MPKSPRATSSRRRLPVEDPRAASRPQFDNPRFVHDGKVLIHQGSVFDKLTDPTLYTGSSKCRFDAQGRGRGVEGRESHSLYALTAAESVREADSLPYGDDREARRWSSSLRAGLYSRVVDEQSRMRRAELLHEREVATRGRMWKYSPEDVAPPVFEHWQLDPLTGTLRLDEVRTSQLMHGPANEFERMAAQDASAPRWTDPVPVGQLPPPPPASSAEAFARRHGTLGASHTPPPRRDEAGGAAAAALLRLEPDLPPRPLSSWEIRELAITEGAASARSAASIPGALPAWSALRDRTGLQSPPAAAALGQSNSGAVFSPHLSSGPSYLSSTGGDTRSSGPQWIDDPRRPHHMRPPSVDELMAAVEAQSRFTY